MRERGCHDDGSRPDRSSGSVSREGMMNSVELRTILVATDLSDEGRVALEAARWLMPESDSVLHVVHCLAPGAGTTSVQETRALLLRHLEVAGLEPSQVRLHTPVGAAHIEIHRTAEELGVQLTVLGRHRPRRAMDGLLGSTADRVIRTSGIPCLVVNQPLARRPRSIMVAVDLSPHADQALNLAESWAAGWMDTDPASDGEGDGEVKRIALHVVGIADFARPGYRPVPLADGLAARVREMSARGSAGIRFESMVRSAPLAPEGLLRVAEELRPDLVFMGTHGHGPILRALYGSVTSEVIRTLPLAAVVVPQPRGK